MRRRNFFAKIIDFFKEVKLELKRVNWPTIKETLKNTLIVISISVAVAVLLGGADFIFKKILDKFILR